MKNRHLIQNHDGITVVWVDDRVLVEANDLAALTMAGVEACSATCMDEDWFTAVLDRNAGAIDEMVITEQQKYAAIALSLMEVCTECGVNLILADFEKAHDVWFRAPNAIFLLDIQNLMKPLERFFQQHGIDDTNWDWDLYGLRCAVAYGMPLSRFRFFTRFRGRIAESLPDWSNNLFPDYSYFERNAVMLDANTTIIKERIREFIKNNLLHEDRHITEMLLWFLDLPLTRNGLYNHAVLGEQKALEKLKHKFKVAEVCDESAKAIALGTNDWLVSATTNGYQLKVSVLQGALKALGFPNVALKDLTENDWLRLPCAPALPMLLSLKALIHEMNRCPKYHGPTSITITAIQHNNSLIQYRLNLFLADTDRNGTAVSMAAFKRSFKEWDEAGRIQSERHQTRQRIGDFLRFRLTVSDGYHPSEKPLLLNGVDDDVLRVEFNENPTRMEFIWEARP